MPDRSEERESAVTLAWARGDVSPAEAFERLYRSYAPVVRAWLGVRAPGDADDLFQDVWTIFYRRMPEWEHREGLDEPDAKPVLSFLFRTCHLVLQAHRRLHARRASDPLETAAAAHVDDHERITRQIQLGECLSVARSRCTDEELAVLTARLAGLAGRDIAHTLHVSEAAVDHRFRRALSRIREALAPLAEDSHA